MKTLGGSIGREATILVLPDVHYPVHDWRALALVEQVAADLTCDAVVQLGDYLDVGALGRWVVGKPRVTEGDRLRADAEMGAEWWQKIVGILRKRNPNCAAFMLQGNHEHRLERFLDENPYLEGLITVPQLLLLKDTSTTWVPVETERGILRFDWGRKGIVPRSYRMDDWQGAHGFAFTHGWFTGIHSAKKHVECYGRGPIVYGHTHHVQTFTPRIMGWPKPFAATIGHLSLRGDYMAAPDSWALAFGIVTMGSDVGEWDLQIARIHKGQKGRYSCALGGKRYAMEVAA